jgi:hypothetical protein
MMANKVVCITIKKKFGLLYQFPKPVPPPPKRAA